jgi:hypothetical protein
MVVGCVYVPLVLVEVSRKCWKCFNKKCGVRSCLCHLQQVSGGIPRYSEGCPGF